MNSEKPEINTEEEIEKSGSCGLFQGLLVVMVAVPVFLVGCLMVISIFETMTPEYKCANPYTNEFEKKCNVSWSDDWYNKTVPVVNGKPSTCERYIFDNETEICSAFLAKSNHTLEVTGSNLTVPCSEWVYDDVIMKHTVVTDFNLVCGGTWRGYISQSVFMLGVGIGNIVSGAASDRFGRRKTFLCCGIGWMVFGIITAFAKSYLSYTLLAAATGFFGYCLFPVLFILGSEFMVVKHRATFQQFLEVSFAIGISILSALALLTRDWRILRLAISIPVVVIIPIWWFLPESPRWLLCRGKKLEAEKIFRRIKRMNGHVVTNNELISSDIDANENLNGNSSDEERREHLPQDSMWKTMATITSLPGLRKITFIQFFEWFSVSCVYYGLTFNAASLGGDPFSNLFFGASFEAVANVLTIPLVNGVGRTPTVSVTQIISGIFCIAMPFASDSAHWLYAGVSIVGRTFIACAFSSIYIHVSELYPTPVRSFGTGICSAWARLGGIFSPLIAMMALINPNLPYVVFGILSIAAGILSASLPETNKYELQSTIKSGEAFIVSHPGPLWKLCKREKRQEHFY